jgi:undecaprenyl-diphosphatase
MAATVVAGYVAIVAMLILGGLAVVHLGLLQPARHWDDHVNEWFVAHRTPRLDRVSGWFTWIANTMGIVVVAALVTALLLVRRWGRWALLLVLGLGLELASFLSANYTVRRPRPDVSHVGSTPTTFSWPSGHVAATFVLYAGIAVLVMMATRHVLARAASWTVAVVLTTGVALSRVYRGEHHVLDVSAGLLLGIGALLVALLAIDRLRPEEER